MTPVEDGLQFLGKHVYMNVVDTLALVLIVNVVVVVVA